MVAFGVWGCSSHTSMYTNFHFARQGGAMSVDTCTECHQETGPWLVDVLLRKRFWKYVFLILDIVISLESKTYDTDTEKLNKWARLSRRRKKMYVLCWFHMNSVFCCFSCSNDTRCSVVAPRYLSMVIMSKDKTTQRISNFRMFIASCSVFSPLFFSLTSCLHSQHKVNSIWFELVPLVILVHIDKKMPYSIHFGLTVLVFVPLKNPCLEGKSFEVSRSKQNRAGTAFSVPHAFQKLRTVCKFKRTSYVIFRR